MNAENLRDIKLVLVACELDRMSTNFVQQAKQMELHIAKYNEMKKLIVAHELKLSQISCQADENNLEFENKLLRSKINVLEGQIDKISARTEAETQFRHLEKDTNYEEMVTFVVWQAPRGVNHIFLERNTKTDGCPAKSQ